MIGRTVGQYKIEEQLGSGGMGIVYKAMDTRLQRPVALKFLPPHMNADENAKERFIQEARAASALDHANICTIYDVGEEDGQMFIAMAYYDGQTLKYVLDERKMEASEAVLVAHQIAAGLSRAHEAGIVHRDVKPANIMLTSRGEVKILDFGVAKLSESADLTKEGSTIGTAAYMSPEQARGESLDARADIWSIGVLLYEMLAGKRPFGGTYEAAFVYAIINEDPAPLNVDLPEGLADLVSMCLSKLPENRFQSCSDLTAALDPFLSPSGARHAAATTVASGEEVTTIPSAGKIAGGYILVGALVLGFVYAVMMGFGLPDWVFQAGIILIVLGLPILLFAANGERNGSGPEWLSFKKAMWGGVLSISSLSLVTAAFMIMRVMGIGPAATLQSSGALDEDATLLVAEFENQTQDETLGSSVTELLKIDLSQSSAISLMDGASIVSVLSRMNRASETKIDLDTAMEIAAREGVEAVVTGEIRQIGAGFAVSARLLAAADGTELRAFRVTAEDDTEIIGAIDRLSGDVREQIGESIKTIRANEDLDHVTTSSLDALRTYSQGVVASDVGEYDRSIELLNQAIELDSTFAMAFRKLAVVHGNAGSSPELAQEAAAKAYEYREKLPEREKWLAVAYYYAEVDEDLDQRIQAYENLLEKYPDDTAALNNVSIDYNRMNELEKAEEYLKRALDLGDRYVYYSNLLNSLSGQKKWDEVDALIARFKETNPDHPAQSNMEFKLAMARGEYEAADTLVKSASFNNDLFWQVTDAANRADYFVFRGRLEDLRRETQTGVQLNLERGIPSEALGWTIALAYHGLKLTGDKEEARRIATDGLSANPLESIPALARPYTDLVRLYARLGDVEEAKRLMAEYRRVVPEQEIKGNFFRHQAQADILLAEGKPDEALREMRKSQSIDRCHACFYFEQAQALAAMDSLEAAAELLDVYNNFSQIGPFWYFAPDRAPAFYLTGDVYARLGDTEKAIEAYTNFVDQWINADAELQPQVKFAQDRIGRLLDQKAREN